MQPIWTRIVLYLHSFPKIANNGSCAVVKSVKCNAWGKVDLIFMDWCTSLTHKIANRLAFLQHKLASLTWPDCFLGAERYRLQYSHARLSYHRPLAFMLYKATIIIIIRGGTVWLYMGRDLVNEHQFSQLFIVYYRDTSGRGGAL